MLLCAAFFFLNRKFISTVLKHLEDIKRNIKSSQKCLYQWKTRWKNELNSLEVVLKNINVSFIICFCLSKNNLRLDTFWYTSPPATHMHTNHPHIYLRHSYMLHIRLWYLFVFPEDKVPLYPTGITASDQNAIFVPQEIRQLFQNYRI